MVTLALSLNRGLLSHLDSNTIAHWNSHKWSLENRLTAWVIVWGRGKSLLSCLPGASHSALLLGGWSCILSQGEDSGFDSSAVGLKVNGNSFPSNAEPPLSKFRVRVAAVKPGGSVPTASFRRLF